MVGQGCDTNLSNDERNIVYAKDFEGWLQDIIGYVGYTSSREIK
jgi:hypothetical protein